MTSRLGARALIAAIVLCFPSLTAAQMRRLDDGPLTPRLLALGGRADAIGSSTSSMFSNPAMMVHTRAYHVDAYGLYDPTVSRFGFGSAAIDSTRQYFAAGLSYWYNSISDAAGNDFRRMHDARLTLAAPLGNLFGIGFTTRFLDAQPFENRPSILRAGDRPTGWTGFTFDAGLYARPVPALTLSVAGYNLNYVNLNTAPIMMGLGVSLAPVPVFSLVADALVDFVSVPGAVRGRYSAGAELFVANHVPIRAGYSFDHVHDMQHSVGAGVGYLDEVWGVELGVRQGIHPVVQTTIMASARFFYRPSQ